MAFITTNEQIKEANSSVTVDLSIASLRSFIADAEDKFRPIFGISAFEELEAKTEEKAFKKMQTAIVNMALFFYADSGQLLISDTGMQVAKSANKLPASDKKIIAFKRGVFRKAWASFEQCLMFMEAEREKFPVWNVSKNRELYVSHFIVFTADFNVSSNIQISEDLFQVLRSEIRAVERDVLPQLMGETFFNAMITKLRNGTNLEEIEDIAATRIRNAIAPLALAAAIPYLQVDITSGGVYQLSEAALSSQSDNIQNRSIPNERVLQSTMNRLISAGESELESLRGWLNTNRASFPGYLEQKVAPMADFNSDLTDTNVFWL